MSKVYHNSFYAMGTRFNALFPSSDEEVCERIISLIEKEVIRIENKLSYFNSTSEISLINRNACKAPIKIDDELYLIIESCLNFSELTYGAFDITLRPIMEAYIEDKNLFDIRKDKHASSICNIILDENEKTIFLKDDKTKIDFGGFGKGYALEKVKLILNNSPIQSAFISFGESSILTKGNRADGKEWQVGIKDFKNADESVHTFNCKDGSVSSSSNFYWDDSGQLCKKINVINPFSLSPANEFSIASVISDSPILAEILSTAILIMNDEQINESLKNFQNVEAVKICYNSLPNKKIFYGN